MKDVISFSVPANNSIQEMQLGLTLLRFADFDLRYFQEQCIGAYSKDTPDVFLGKAPHLKEYLQNCHPYCKALRGSDFDQIVLDCVIEHICTEKAVGLEALWVQNITAQDSLGKAIFERITEYKMGSAINQWSNLLRMQAYAIKKMAFIYDGPAADMSVHKAKKLYFDLAFMRLSAALGYQNEDLPKNHVSTAAFLNQAQTLLKNAVNAMEPAIETRTKKLQARKPLVGARCVQDQMAGAAINLLADLEPPELEECYQLSRKYGNLPSAVYQPSGFKAVLDLEFDMLLEKGFYLKREGTEWQRLKYTSRKEAPPAPPPEPETPEIPAEPVTPPASAAVEQQAAFQVPQFPLPVFNKGTDQKGAGSQRLSPDEKMLLAALGARKKAAAHKLPSAKRDDGPKKRLNGVQPEKLPEDKVKMIIRLAEDPARQPAKNRTLQEVNTRCNLIWASMNIRTGWSDTAQTDISEWFRYLTRLRYGIGTGEMTHVALDKFLDATQEVFHLLSDKDE
ncbi:hypothetical protein IZU99_02425 [Oscillospiraceae bacterium CM]|nr:hypothetical protein IZU99_02425 [Oscillospiraceae bacterium CM]